MEKQRYTVQIAYPEETPYSWRIGPFVVMSVSEAGAFRNVRRNFAPFLVDHISRERHPLTCNGILSDRTGKLLKRR